MKILYSQANELNFTKFPPIKKEIIFEILSVPKKKNTNKQKTKQQQKKTTNLPND